MDNKQRPKWWQGIAPGDTVHFTTPHGNPGKGKVVISQPDWVVVNAGGRYGIPQLVNEENYAGHRPGKCRKPKVAKSNRVRSEPLQAT